MTKDEAGTLIKALIVGYPNQQRSKEFLALMGSALVRSGLDPRRVAKRIDEWIRAEKFWPAISDLVEPFNDPPPAPLLLPPSNALPSESGVAILRQLTIERPRQ